jgi:chromosome condensin MukBEF MukE localization factor
MALGEMHQLRRHGGRGDKPAGSLLQPEFFIAKVPDPPAGSPRRLREPTMFRPPGGDDTKLRWDETVFRTGEDIRKPALDTN